MSLKDETVEINLYNIPNPHSDGMIIGHVVGPNLVWVTDLISPRGPIGRSPATVAVGDALRKVSIAGVDNRGRSRHHRQAGGYRSRVGRELASEIRTLRPRRPVMSRAPRLLVLVGQGCEKARRFNGGRRFAQLTEAEQRGFVNNMRQNKVEGWQGPAGGFVYFLLRSDAVDVVYGTVEGYAALGIPYMPHIAPTKRWCEKVDVIIVGSGASGSTFAAVLAKAGKKVVVLEQGPDWQLSDLISSDFWGRRSYRASVRRGKGISSAVRFSTR